VHKVGAHARATAPAARHAKAVYLTLHHHDAMSVHARGRFAQQAGLGSRDAEAVAIVARVSRQAIASVAL